MNSLRDKIDQEVWTAIARNDEIDNVAVATDRILALIAEAMLSDDVVMTMLAAMGMGDGRIVAGRAATTAQLTAAGIAGAAQEGGEGK